MACSTLWFTKSLASVRCSPVNINNNNKACVYLYIYSVANVLVSIKQLL